MNINEIKREQKKKRENRNVLIIGKPRKRVMP